MPFDIPQLIGNLPPELSPRRRKCGSSVEARHGREALVLLLIVACSGSFASARAEEAARLERVTVTGEKTDRSYGDTASSVSVVMGDEVEDIGLATLDEVLSGLPNVLFTGIGNFAPQIRGSDTTGPANGVTAFIAGTRPRATVQLDGRPLTYNEFVFGQTGLWDVEHIEVFRGPQTTLQGRNSVAGAIIIDTRDPTFDFEAGGRAIAGNYDTRQYSGVVSAPIVDDQLAFRISADRRDHESYVDVPRQPVGVDDIEQEESANVRAKLLYLPEAVPDLSVELTLNQAYNRQPQVEYVSPPFDAHRLDTGLPGEFPVFQTRSDSSILNLNYLLAPELELRNTTTFSAIGIDRFTDPGNGIAEIQADEASNETLIEYASPERGLRGVLGVYLFKAKTDEMIDISDGNFDDETRTAAVFGEGTITVFDKLDLTLGARYEREKRERNGSLGPFVVDLDETFDAFLPKLGIAYRPGDRFTYGATVQRGYNAGGAGIAFVPPFPSYVFDPEYVWNYEAFVRSSWLNQRLTVDGNVFYADFEDQQRSAFFAVGDPFPSVIRNAESTKSYGAEISANWLARKDLRIRATLGLLETEIEEFSASAEDLSGNEFARAPHMTGALGATYNHPRGWSVTLEGQYAGSYFSDDDNDPAGKVDSFVVFNTRAGYRIGSYRWFAFVTNLFDRDYELLISPPSAGTPVTAQLGDPREFGLGVEMNF